MGPLTSLMLADVSDDSDSHGVPNILSPLADVSDDSDIHGVPKVRGQSSEDLAKQTFLQVIGIMKNVRRKYQRDLVNGPWNYGVPENVYCLPNVYQVNNPKFRRHITVIAQI